MQQQTTDIMVWDPLIRIFHWLLAVCFAAAYLLEDERIMLHLVAGAVITGLIVFRLVWGIAGTRHARFADFLYKPREVLAHLGQLMRLKAGNHVGHTPAGSVMIFVLIAGLIALCLSGIALEGLQEGRGPMGSMMVNVSLDTGYLIEKVHGFIADALAVLIVLHVGGVVVESWLQKQNLTLAMITGRKSVRTLKPPKRSKYET